MSKESVPRGYRARSAQKTAFSLQDSQRQQQLSHSQAQAQMQNLALEGKRPFVQPLPNPPHTPRTPRTPLRDSYQNGFTPNEYGSKQKSHHKSRSKNNTTSPTMNKKFKNLSLPNTSQSFGLYSESINTPPIAAYAGPTFHSSPAPSALPIPSFYSKSVPDSPRLKGPRSVKDSYNSTSSGAFQLHGQYSGQESPLDIFFKADREQKERARCAASPLAKVAVAESSPVKSPHLIKNISCPNIKNYTQPRHDYKHSVSAMFSMYLDEESDFNGTYEASTFTSYSERINAIRPERYNTVPAPRPPNQLHSIDKAEALKAYLFSGHLTSTSSGSPHTMEYTSPLVSHRLNQTTVPFPCNEPTNSDAPSHHPQGHVGNKGLGGINHVFRAPASLTGLRQEAISSQSLSDKPGSKGFNSSSPSPSRCSRINPSTNHNNTACNPDTGSSIQVSQTPDIQEMEDSLRKILKLDSVRSNGVSTLDIGQVPSAVIPAQSYVLDGVHL